MTSDMKGNYSNAYTYGLDRISVDNLTEENNIKTDPLYYLYDGRGSVSEVINTKGQVRDKYNYESFGITNHGGYLGSSATHYENFYGYNGEDYNRLSGLQYLRARYYEPETGRFLTRDSYLGSIMNPLSQNRYAYGENNPIMNIDPSGHWPQWLSNIGNKISSGINKAVTATKNFVSNVVSTVKNTVSYVADKVTDFIRPAVNYVQSTPYYPYVERYVEGVKASANSMAKRVIPAISTINYANEIVRDTIEAVKKTCEGAEYIGSKIYEHKEQILNAVTVGIGTGLAVAAVIAAAPVVGAAVGIASVGAAATLGVSSVAIGTAATGVGYGVAAGIGAFGLSNIGEVFTGKNAIKDKVFNGNDEAYNTTEFILNVAGAGIVTGAASLPQNSSSKQNTTSQQKQSESKNNVGSKVELPAAGDNLGNMLKGVREPKETLFHYTNEKGMNGIVESKQLNPSLKANNPKDARYGNGQYLSDIMPDSKTPSQLAKQFINVPNKYKFTNYVEIDVSGLNLTKGRDGVFVIPNESSLDLTGRIISSGKVGAK